jgi:hypothetical protein
MGIMSVLIPLYLRLLGACASDSRLGFYEIRAEI